MDGFLAPVIPGVVGALVGAIAAFYLGGVREKQKWIEEREQKLNERRAEALDDIRAQAYSFAQLFGDWTGGASNLRISPEDEGNQVLTFLKRLEELAQQGDEVSIELASLRGHYDAHRPKLDERTRNIVESFEEQAIERHSSLLNQIRSTAASLQPFLLLTHPVTQADAVVSFIS